MDNRSQCLMSVMTANMTSSSTVANEANIQTSTCKSRIMISCRVFEYITCCSLQGNVRFEYVSIWVDFSQLLFAPLQRLT